MGGWGTAGGNMQHTDSIILPLPQSLIDSGATSFSEESMGDVASGAANLLGNAVGAGADYFTRGIASSVIDFGAATEKATKIGYAAAGVTPNKFMTIVLQGPQYKKHSFTWKLYPKTSSESIELNRIINLLKKSMRTKLAGQNFFFEFPKVFQMSFSPNENFLYAFKPAVMESMSVNYTPSGSPNFYGKTGAPDGVILTMNFWELEYWLSDDPKYSDIANAVGEIAGDVATGFKYGGIGGAALGYSYGAASVAAKAIYNLWEGN
jgi:hypothetical protein